MIVRVKGVKRARGCEVVGGGDGACRRAEEEWQEAGYAEVGELSEVFIR